MKAVKQASNKSCIKPEDELSQAEFIEEIRKAEQAPFHSIEESKKRFEEWCNARQKK